MLDYPPVFSIIPIQNRRSPQGNIMTTAPSAATDRSISPLDAFGGTFAPTEPGFLYKAGLAVVAFAMVLLPTIYLALVAAVVWVIKTHLQSNFGLLTQGSGGSLGRAMIYFGPAVAGAILVFFMVKPFFAKQPKTADPIVLDPSQEPLLFAFVEKICRLVGAPIPSRIEVDCQVNASAGLRKGFLSRDLTLTIGLPLAAGLNMRQFAGVLAHEFGHFAQGAGMRMTYVIRKISFWFARVVYERDSWDLQLEHAAKNMDFRIGIILHAARGCVWLTRRILWVLMNVGNAISCFMLRQMEYDADSYEAKLAGSETFEQTAARLRTLNVAAQFAYSDLRQSWTSNRLPESLPSLIHHRAATLAPDLRQEIAKDAEASRTGWFDTHPCDADRIRAARALKQSGVFAVEEPATGLFANFAELSKAVTVHQYQNEMELKFEAANLVPTEEMLREAAATDQAAALLRSFYGEVDISLKPLLVEEDPFTRVEPSPAEWLKARENCAALLNATQKTSSEWSELQQKVADARTAHRLTKAGFRIKPKEFGLPSSATSLSEQQTAAREALDATASAASDKLIELEPFMDSLRHRVRHAVALALTSPEFAATPEAAQLPAQAALLSALGAELANMHDLASRLPGFASLAENRANHSDPPVVEKALAETAAEVRSLVDEVRSRLDSFAYPLPHARGQVTVAEYTRADEEITDELQRAYVEGAEMIRKVFTLHYRMLGAVLAAAEAGEKLAGAATPLERRADQDHSPES